MFRRYGIDALRKHNIQEVHCSLEDLLVHTGSRDQLYHLGLTDAVLLYVSELEHGVILTDDQRLVDRGSWQSQLLLLDNLLKADQS